MSLGQTPMFPNAVTLLLVDACAVTHTRDADVDIGLKIAKDYIGLGPTDHVCCASAYTSKDKKHASCDWLKPYLLMFDTVFVDEVGSLIHNAESRDVADTYQWLLDERVIDQYPRSIYREIDRIALSPTSQALLSARDDLLGSQSDLPFDEAKFRAVASRWEAAVLADFMETNAVCVEQSFHSIPTDTVTTNALRVVVENFPVPHDKVPFEEILQLRSEKDLMQKRAPLRNWCRKLAGLSESAVRDELASQLADYEAYMRIQKVKFGTQALEMVVTTPAGVLEDILKLRFENLVSRIFKIGEKRVALAEAELKAPSRELAFIVEARDRLPH